MGKANIERKTKGFAKPAKPAPPKRIKKNSIKSQDSKIPGIDVGLLLASIGSGHRKAEYQVKDTIFRQGDPTGTIFYIVEGRVQITIVSEQGKEGIIAHHVASEFFGESCLTGQKLYLASATALEPTSVITIDKQTMVHTLSTNQTFSDMFMAFLLTRNVQIESDLVDQLFNSSERRLARALLLLANFGKDGKMEKVIPAVTQDTLAARVGTTRSRINFFMNKFRKLGLIEYNGELKVHSALLNIVIHD